MIIKDLMYRLLFFVRQKEDPLAAARIVGAMESAE